MKKVSIVFLCIIAVVAFAIWASPASAFPTYSCDGTGDDPTLCFDGADGTTPDSGNCANCHGGFREPSYISITADDSVPWGVDLMTGHLRTYGVACNECHINSARTPVYLNPEVSGVDQIGLGCVGCHGRFEDITPNDGVFGGTGPNWGDGLRAHHASAGFTLCAICHTADSVQVGEDVPPETYAILSIDSCDEDGGDLTFTGNYGNVGLDNDGDDLREPDDPDCVEGNDPPIANPGGPYTGTVGVPVQFDGSGSYDSDGTIVSYDWDFGDGNSGTGAKPTHTYADTVIYMVTLTVTDNDGATDATTTTAYIEAAPNQPPVADPNGPYTGTVGVPVQFDGSGSSDPDGTIVSYDWDFGDGSTGTGVSPSHSYSFAGTNTVSLTVTDNGGLTDTATTTATITALPNRPPVADPNGPYNGIVGVPVQFDGSGSSDPDGTIFSYDWDFGDGSDGTGVSPSHSYSAAGTYTVFLTVTDDGGLADTKTSSILIEDPVDLDIAQFRVTKRVKLSRVKPVQIKLVVKSDRRSEGYSRLATVIGMQGRVEVYNEIMNVGVPLGFSRSPFNFPPYTPVAVGDITWSATIADDDPDIDVAIATTKVVP
jgi:PKD repeat protein